MSLFTRSSVVCAIIFGCFAVLIPRIFLPFFRPRPTNIDDHFRRPSPPPSISPNIHDDSFERNSDSSLHMHGAHPNMRMPHPGMNSRDQPLTEQSNTKSAVTFALPMYAVGIAVFFIYTCFKYMAKRNTQGNGMKLQYSTDNIRWNAHNKKFKYQKNNHFIEDDDNELEEDFYAGLDPEYIEYLKLKRQKEFETKQRITTEQKQMHDTLDQMKHSLSFINSKLGSTKTANTLTNSEIAQLQERLASTETQMYQILSALDAATNKMNEITKNTRESFEQPHQPFNREEEYQLSSRSRSESEGSINEEENSNSDENSSHQDEQILFNKNEQDEESSSSYEDDDEVPNGTDDDDDDDDDDESGTSSNRYGLMNTNYGSDPTTIDDYELNTIPRPIEIHDTQTKVKEWHERNHSQSLGSSNCSLDQDQSIPNDEQNHLSQNEHRT